MTSNRLLPEGVQGPFFNDEFGDTYSLIFALTSDGFGQRELRDYAERVRAELLGVPDVSKIDLLGTQDEKSTWSSPRNSSPPWGSTFPS